ncbi:la-related protein 1C isoform X2 [Daucus carota subsp. sativus]|uniref:la-related protein 1C isoform X2 n=1 Tax=Daucus carota subsp. sativus TaxID=79200 RepID=UPI0007EF8130|nr:PREDICTED: la-related protein 1C-like isoform X2 [Daucus carota subsp. sativus]
MAASSESIAPCLSVSEDNAAATKSSASSSPWMKPVNGVVEPVMGRDSWPTITESTRYPLLVKSSSDPPDAAAAAASSLSVSVSKGSVKSNAHQKADTNGSPNSSNHNAHPHPVRQRPSKRGGGAAGGSVQSGFSRPIPPSPTPPPFPIPFGLLPPMMDLQVREPPFKGNTWESRPVGGVGSQSNNGNDHSSQRHPSRRGNYGSRPRGDGMHYNGHGGRRDQDRNWNPPRNSTARDVHMHQMAPPPPPPPRFMRPGLPGSTPFIPLPHVYGNPMPFEFVRPILYGPPLPPESLRGVPLIPSQVPPPVVFPFVDPNLPSLLVNQIDYYFSDDNLVKDEFLRSKMDEQGWVNISVIANFRRVLSLTSNVQLILDALGTSTVVEVQGDKIRRRDNWKKWISPSRQNITLDESDSSKLRTVETGDAHLEVFPGKISGEATSSQTKVGNGVDTAGEV